MSRGRAVAVASASGVIDIRAWGLLADIEPPELEVRIAILRKKAAVESVPLPDDVAMYIASSIKSSSRWPGA